MTKKRSSDKKGKKQSIPEIPAPKRGRGRPKGSKNKSHKHVKSKKIKVVKPVKEPKIVNTGYRQYLSELSKYNKEHGIKLHGRGSFLRKGSEIWKDLKGKPDVIQNIDVILDSYLQPEPTISERAKLISDDISLEQYMWWNIKNLYGFWSLNKFVDIKVDRLFLIDIDGLEIDITQQADAFAMYKQLSQYVDDEVLAKYSYLTFNRVWDNKEGVYVYYNIKEDDEFTLRSHEKNDLDWNKDIKNRWLKKRIKAAKKEDKATAPKVESGTEKWLPQQPQQPATSSRLQDLISYKSSLIQDIEYAEKRKRSTADDEAELIRVKSEIKKLMNV
jgi:hypothetical protein